MNFKKIKQCWHRLASPPFFYQLSARILPVLSPLAWLLLLVALFWGLAFAPADYQQGNAFRIIYIHVPTAALSMSLYVLMALVSLISFVWNIRLAAMLARNCANIGAVMTLLALLSGSIWGKPTWGTWWTWDARLTSELILFFLYISYIMLDHAIEDRRQADRLCALLALIGVINIPIIHYSVVWWNSLHQGATIFKLAVPSIAPSMLYPLLLSLLAFYLWAGAWLLRATQNSILSARIQQKTLERL